MNTEQAYIEGFVKRAFEYGFNENEAIEMLKEAAGGAGVLSKLEQAGLNPGLISKVKASRKTLADKLRSDISAARKYNSSESALTHPTNWLKERDLAPVKDDVQLLIDEIYKNKATRGNADALHRESFRSLFPHRGLEESYRNHMLR